MDLEANLSASAAFTGKIFRNWGRLLLLIALSIIPIVNLIVVGYMARIVRENPDEPPRLENYAGLLLNGLLVFIAWLIYAAVPLIFIILGLGTWLFSRTLSLLGLALFVVGVLLLLGAMVIGTVAIGYMIKRDMDFTKIFAFQEVWGLIQRIGVGRYLVWYLVMAALGLVAAALGWMIPWVGGAIAGVFFGLFANKSLALLLDEALKPTQQAEGG